jgi:transcriptional regulator with XRE-family HTH domain
MDTQPGSVGELLRDTRVEAGLSTHDVARMAGVNQATIVRLEDGSIRIPRTDTLAKVAAALQLNVATVFTVAGITPPAALPAMGPYLRTKYRDLGAEDITAIERYAARLAKRRGVNIDGPAPGEDET